MFPVSIIVISLVVLSLTPYWFSSAEPRQIDISEKRVMSILWYFLYLIPVYGLLYEAFHEDAGKDNTLELSIFSIVIAKIIIIPFIISGEMYSPLELANAFLNLLLLTLIYIKNLLPDLTFTEWLLLGIFWLSCLFAYVYSN